MPYAFRRTIRVLGEIRSMPNNCEFQPCQNMGKARLVKNVFDPSNNKPDVSYTLCDEHEMALRSGDPALADWFKIVIARAKSN